MLHLCGYCFRVRTTTSSPSQQADVIRRNSQLCVDTYTIGTKQRYIILDCIRRTTGRHEIEMKLDYASVDRPDESEQRAW